MTTIERRDAVPRYNGKGFLNLTLYYLREFVMLLKKSNAVDSLFHILIDHKKLDC